VGLEWVSRAGAAPAVGGGCRSGERRQGAGQAALRVAAAESRRRCVLRASVRQGKSGWT